MQTDWRGSVLGRADPGPIRRRLMPRGWPVTGPLTLRCLVVKVPARGPVLVGAVWGHGGRELQEDAGCVPRQAGQRQAVVG